MLTDACKYVSGIYYANFVRNENFLSGINFLLNSLLKLRSVLYKTFPLHVSRSLIVVSTVALLVLISVFVIFF